MTKTQRENSLALNADVTPDNFEDKWHAFKKEIPVMVKCLSASNRDGMESMRDGFLDELLSMGAKRTKRRRGYHLDIDAKSIKSIRPTKRWQTVITALRMLEIIDGLIRADKPYAAVLLAMHNSELFHQVIPESGPILPPNPDLAARSGLDQFNHPQNVLDSMQPLARSAISHHLRMKNAAQSKRVLNKSPTPEHIREVFMKHISPGTSLSAAREATMRDLLNTGYKTSMRTVLRYSGTRRRGRPKLK